MSYDTLRVSVGRREEVERKLIGSGKVHGLKTHPAIRERSQESHPYGWVVTPPAFGASIGPSGIKRLTMQIFKLHLRVYASFLELKVGREIK